MQHEEESRMIRLVLVTVPSLPLTSATISAQDDLVRSRET